MRCSTGTPKLCLYCGYLNACESEIYSNHVFANSYSSTVADTIRKYTSTFHDRCLKPRSPYPGRTGSELEISGGRRGGGILGITSWTAIRHNLTTLKPAPHKRGIPEIRNDGPISGTGLWLFGHYLARGAMRLREPRGASTPDRE